MVAPIGDNSGPQKNASAATSRAPAPGSLNPTVRPAAIPGESAPSGSSLATPRPAPLPERGASLILFITLAAAFLAVTFSILIALKL